MSLRSLSVMPAVCGEKLRNCKLSKKTRKEVVPLQKEEDGPSLPKRDNGTHFRQSRDSIQLLKAPEVAVKRAPQKRKKALKDSKTPDKFAGVETSDTDTDEKAIEDFVNVLGVSARCFNSEATQGSNVRGSGNEPRRRKSNQEQARRRRRVSTENPPLDQEHCSDSTKKFHISNSNSSFGHQPDTVASLEVQPAFSITRRSSAQRDARRQQVPRREEGSRHSRRTSRRHSRQLGDRTSSECLRRDTSRKSCVSGVTKRVESVSFSEQEKRINSKRRSSVTAVRRGTVTRSNKRRSSLDGNRQGVPLKTVRRGSAFVSTRRGSGSPHAKRGSILAVKRRGSASGATRRESGTRRRRSSTVRFMVEGKVRSASSVCFNTVEIREYGVELGDNPSCSSGPAITIGWNYRTVLRKNISEYEATRRPRRYVYQLYIPKDTREAMLKRSGFSSSQIATAVRRTGKDRSQRKATISNMKYQHYEMSLENARRKFMTFLRFGRNEDAEAEKKWGKRRVSRVSHAA